MFLSHHVLAFNLRSSHLWKIHWIDGRVWVWVSEECERVHQTAPPSEGATQSIDGWRRWYGIILWWISTLYISSPPAEAVRHNGSSAWINQLDNHLSPFLYSPLHALIGLEAWMWLLFHIFIQHTTIWNFAVFQLISECYSTNFKMLPAQTKLSVGDVTCFLSAVKRWSLFCAHCKVPLSH